MALARAPARALSVKGAVSPAPHRARLRPAAAAAAAAAAALRAVQGQLVDELLELVEHSDCGATLSGGERAEADELIRALEAAGAAGSPVLERARDAPDSPYGRFSVVYQSVGGEQKGSPAGGRFRGRLGRAIFRTRGLFQNIGPEKDEASNKVDFALFGLIRGYIALVGQLCPCTASEALLSSPGGEVYRRDGARVRFERPILRLGPLPPLRVGPESEVELYTPYCDERIRLGRGSRGSLFVFLRGAPERALPSRNELPPLAGERRRAAAWMCLVAAACLAGWLTATPVGSAVAAAAAAVAVAVAGVIRGGGIVDDDESARAARNRKPFA